MTPRDGAAHDPGGKTFPLAPDVIGGAEFGGPGNTNAVGLPTKRAPRRDPAAYLRDRDLPEVVNAVRADLLRLGEHVKAGGTVVWPSAGIGTGLADLPRRAPRIAAYMDKVLARLEAVTR